MYIIQLYSQRVTRQQVTASDNKDAGIEINANRSECLFHQHGTVTVAKDTLQTPLETS